MFKAPVADAQRWFVAFIIIVALGGATLAWSGLHYVRDSLTTAGVTLIAAAVVALTAAGGFSTWSADRIRTRDEKARASYEALSIEMMGRYTKSDLGKLRAQVATSADIAVVSALSEWNQAYDRNVQSEASGDVDLSTKSRDEMREATVRVMAAIRKQHGVAPGDYATLEHALFNDPPRTPSADAGSVGDGDEK